MGGYVETPRFRVLKQTPAFELRQYEPMVVAETEVPGGSEDSQGFRTLAGYIFGGNARGQSISMTAPVAQQEVAGSDGARVTMSFMMPRAHALEDLPHPKDSRVRLKRVDQGLMAAVVFSGQWNRSDVASRTEALRQGVLDAGMTVVGPPVFARYDPPWTPPFLRRNEIMVPVAAAR